MIAAGPALILPRPALAWPSLIAIGATLYAGQFLLQFFAIASGLPPGLASLLVQTQATASAQCGQAPTLATDLTAADEQTVIQAPTGGVDRQMKVEAMRKSNDSVGVQPRGPT